MFIDLYQQTRHVRYAPILSLPIPCLHLPSLEEITLVKSHTYIFEFEKTSSYTLSSCFAPNVSLHLNQYRYFSGYCNQKTASLNLIRLPTICYSKRCNRLEYLFLIFFCIPQTFNIQ